MGVVSLHEPLPGAEGHAHTAPRRPGKGHSKP
jgi:hypothetical protein